MENERLIPAVTHLCEVAIKLLEATQNQSLMTNAILKALEARKEIPDFHASYEAGFQEVSYGDVARRIVREQETIAAGLQRAIEELKSL
jgi:predicted RNA-binding Zn ribbon-like protein